MWKKYNIEESKIYFWKLGACEFWVRKMNKEWQIGTNNTERSDKTAIADEVGEPIDAAWKSFIADKNNTLNVLPSLPDQPLVVKPDDTFKLLPKMSVQLYVHIPLWIQLYAGTSKKENLIHEFSSEELSNTWFGEPDNGFLAYALPKAFYTSVQKELLFNNEVLCPIKITNDYSTLLDFQRLSIQADQLNIYSDSNLLFTNEIKVKFKGESIVSDIHYSQQAPSFLKNPKQIAAPRNADNNNVLKKSFHFIKSLTDF